MCVRNIKSLCCLHYWIMTMSHRQAVRQEIFMCHYYLKAQCPEARYLNCCCSVFSNCLIVVCYQCLSSCHNRVLFLSQLFDLHNIQWTEEIWPQPHKIISHLTHWNVLSCLSYVCIHCIYLWNANQIFYIYTD